MTVSVVLVLPVRVAVRVVIAAARRVVRRAVPPASSLLLSVVASAVAVALPLPKGSHLGVLSSSARSSWGFSFEVRSGIESSETGDLKWTHWADPFVSGKDAGKQTKFRYDATGFMM